MLPRLAAACTFVALSVSPCFGQSLAPGADPDRFTLAGTVRRAWQADAKGLLELVTAKHPRGANRCWTQKGKINERVDCFQRLIERHFLRQVTSESTPVRSWCVDDRNPRHCFESLAAQEVERWRYNRMNASAAPAVEGVQAVDGR
jgi:hypothetical protein